MTGPRLRDRRVILAAMIAAASGCAKPPAPAQHHASAYVIGKPYRIDGAWFYPQADEGYDDTGIACLYSDMTVRPYTDNDEPWESELLTGAHKTLPLPCLVRVTNLDNGRSVVVRINDRGRLPPGRIVALTRKAGALLAFGASGLGKVRVTILAAESRILAAALQAPGTGSPGQGAPLPADTAPAPAAAPRVRVEVIGVSRAGATPPDRGRPEITTVPGETLPDGRFLPAPVVTQVAVTGRRQILVEAGPYALYDQANRKRAALSPLGPAAIVPFRSGRSQYFHVRVGPLASVDRADAVLAQAISAAVGDVRIIVE